MAGNSEESEAWSFLSLLFEVRQAPFAHMQELLTHKHTHMHDYLQLCMQAGQHARKQKLHALTSTNIFLRQ